MDGLGSDACQIHILQVGVLEYIYQFVDDRKFQKGWPGISMHRHIDDDADTVEDKISDGVVEDDDKHAEEALLVGELCLTELPMSRQIRQHTDSLDLYLFILCGYEEVLEGLENLGAQLSSEQRILGGIIVQDICYTAYSIQNEFFVLLNTPAICSLAYHGDKLAEQILHRAEGIECYGFFGGQVSQQFDYFSK